MGQKGLAGSPWTELVDRTNLAQAVRQELELHPLGLLQQGVRGYLVATTFDYEAPVLYALHRFDSVEAMDEPAKRPAGFSLDAFVERGGTQFGGGRAIALKAHVSEMLAHILDETPLSKDQKITKGKKGLVLHATVFDSWQLRFWILLQGAEIVVRQPVALRREIEGKIEEMKVAYDIGRIAKPSE